MRDGIYRIEVRWPVATSHGVAVAKEGDLRGIDQNYLCLGKYTTKDGIIKMDLDRHPLPTNSARVIPSHSVKLSGAVTEEAIVIHGVIRCVR